MRVLDLVGTESPLQDSTLGEELPKRTPCAPVNQLAVPSNRTACNGFFRILERFYRGASGGG